MVNAFMAFLLLSVLHLVQGRNFEVYGTIRPETEAGIMPSVSNINESADYTFKFYPDTTIPAAGTITITFPYEYTSGLGITTATCTGGTCTVSGYDVVITTSVQLYTQDLVTVIVHGVTNPSAQGGTGPFKIVTRGGFNILDENYVFGVIGIAPAQNILTSTSALLMSGGDSTTSSSTYYDFRLQTQEILPAWSWLRFTFPSEFSLINSPNCTAVEVEDYTPSGDLTCLTDSSGQAVKLTGLSEDISAERDIAIRVQATNPSYVLTTSTFKIESGRNNTNTVYEYSLTVPGVTITPSPINSISLLAVDSTTTLARSKQVYYELKFTPSNTIAQGGTIEIQFNNNFNLDPQAIDNQNIDPTVESGLFDIDVNTRTTCVYDSATLKLTIADFLERTPNEIVVRFQAVNPFEDGETTPLIITTKDASGNIQDQDSENAKTTISTLTSPVITKAEPTNLYATGALTDLKFTLVPNVMVPLSGFVLVKYPTGFSVGTITSCQVEPKNVAIKNAAACVHDATAQTIKFTLTANAGPPTDQFVVLTDSSIKFESANSGLSLPTVSGKYIFDITTQNQNGVSLESGSITLTVEPEALGTTSKPMHSGQGIDNIIVVEFTPVIAVPSGLTPTKNWTDEQGFIEVRLGTNTNEWDPDLGIGATVGTTLYCVGVSGISPAETDGNILCEVSALGTVATGQYTIIKVTEFGAITATSAFELHIAGVKATGTSAPIEVYTYKEVNRVRTDLNTQTQTGFTIGAVVASTAAVPTTTTTDNEIYATNTIAGPTILTAGTQVQAGGKILVLFSVNHHSGYCTDSVPTCNVNAASVTCRCYPTAELIVIDGVTLPATTNFSYEIANLINPGAVPEVEDDLQLVTIDYGDVGGARTVIEQLDVDPITKQTQGSFTLTDMETGSYLHSMYDVTWQINFTVDHKVTAGGTIEIIFPSQFGLSASSPLPQCYITTVLPLTGDSVTCSFQNSLITVSNLAEFHAGTAVDFVLKGVRNPPLSAGASTGNFQITTRTAEGFTVDTKTDFTGLTFSGEYSPSIISFNQIEAYPRNAGINAMYIIPFYVTASLPSGSQIEIRFPSTNFGNAGFQSSTCVMAGAMRTMASCVMAGNAVYIVTDQDHSATTTDRIDIYINKIQNPPVSVTEAFTIETTFDSIVVDLTDASAGGNSGYALLSSAPSTLTVNSIDFYPQNEGEKATYIFSFTPQQDVDQDTSFVINFPEQFDNALSNDTIDCWATNLDGVITCSVNHREVKLTGHYRYTACGADCMITVYIFGVTNPLVQVPDLSDNFSIGTMTDVDSTYVEYNDEAGTVQIVQAPGLNNVIDVTLSNQNARDLALYNFNMTTQNTIPTEENEGAIWVQFSEDFNLASTDIGSSEIDCQTSSFWADGYPDCTQTQDLVKMTGSRADYVGNMNVGVNDVPNPKYEISSRSTIVKTYDGLNKKIIDSSYTNLSPNRFDFTYPGPLLTVNNDQDFSVERGTMSALLPIELTYPCALNMTLVPTSEGFTFEPYHIEFEQGQLSSSFRVSVPDTTLTADYFIEWSTLGELVPPYYTAVATTPFKVTKNGTEKIYIDTVPDMERGQTSLPIRVWVDSPPNQDITVTLSLPQADINDIVLSTSILEFPTGTHEKFFTLTTSDDMTQRSTSISLDFSGSNLQSYDLDRTEVPFDIVQTVDARVVQPQIISITMSDVTKVSATAVIVTASPMTVYWALQLRNSPSLSFDDIKTQITPTYTSTQTSYGLSYADTTLISTVTITGLTAQNNYVFTACGDDLSGVSAATFEQVFETEARDKAARFTLVFDQDYITVDEVTDIRNNVALVLSLNTWRVISNGTVSSAIPGARRLHPGARRLQVGQSSINLTILDDPTIGTYPSPSDMVEKLDSELAILQKFLPTVSLDHRLDPIDIYIDECQWVDAPQVTENSGHDYISVSGKIEEDGWIFAILLVWNQDEGTPKSWQLYEGLDAVNAPPTQHFANEVYANTTWERTFSDLNPLTTYVMYLTCGNDNPGVPDLKDDIDVKRLTTGTDATPAITPLNLDWAMGLVGIIGLLFF